MKTGCIALRYSPSVFRICIKRPSPGPLDQAASRSTNCRMKS